MGHKKLIEKVPGGILIEDDGGFINFMPECTSVPPLGTVIGVHLGDTEEDEKAVTNDTKKVVDEE